MISWCWYQMNRSKKASPSTSIDSPIWKAKVEFCRREINSVFNSANCAIIGKWHCCDFFYWLFLNWLFIHQTFITVNSIRFISPSTNFSLYLSEWDWERQCLIYYDENSFEFMNALKRPWVLRLQFENCFKVVAYTFSLSCLPP